MQLSVQYNCNSVEQHGGRADTEHCCQPARLCHGKGFAFLCSSFPLTFQYFRNTEVNLQLLLLSSGVECGTAVVPQKAWACYRFCHKRRLVLPFPRLPQSPPPFELGVSAEASLQPQPWVAPPQRCPPHLVQVHVLWVWKMERGNEHLDTVIPQPVLIQVLCQHPCHKVLACARPAVERQSQGLLWPGHL